MILDVFFFQTVWFLFSFWGHNFISLADGQMSVDKIYIKPRICCHPSSKINEKKLYLIIEQGLSQSSKKRK